MPDEPKGEKQDRRVTVLCPHCGELIEVADVHSLILAMHIAEVCDSLEKVWARG